MSFRLVIQRRGRQPQVFRLLQPSVIIGRGKGTDLLLPDISVSRQHARVDREGETGHKIVDLGSQNGTKVNGQQVTERILEPGDELQVGKFMLTYEFKPVRSIEGGTGSITNYSLDDERTGFLRKVSATEGANVHSTTVLSKDQLEHVRKLAHLEESGRIVDANTGDTWRIGKSGLDFGKGGVEILGGGVGGAASIQWNGSAHEIEKAGGLFFAIKVNATEVKKRALKPGDQVLIGKSEYTYEV
jgi:hypothetical protein